MYRAKPPFCCIYYRTRQETSVQLVIIEILFLSFQNPLVFPCLVSLWFLYNMYSAFSWTSLSDLSSFCLPHLLHLVFYSIRMTVLFSVSFGRQIGVFKTKTKGERMLFLWKGLVCQTTLSVLICNVYNWWSSVNVLFCSYNLVDRGSLQHHFLLRNIFTV